jgi:hypothetical protein
MVAGANPNTSNLLAKLEIHSCEGNPSGLSALNHRGQPNLAAVKYPSNICRGTLGFGVVQPDFLKPSGWLVVWPVQAMRGSPIA